MSNKREALEAGLGLAKNHLDNGEHHPESREYILYVIKTIEAALAEPDPLLKMLTHRARTFPNYPLGHHIPEVFAAIGEAPPEPEQEPVMAHTLPPPTKRDQWFYEQGRLAERDPRTPSSENTEQEPVAKQYKHSKTGEWCNFIDEKHYKDTLESGLFEIRSLFASPQPREWEDLWPPALADLMKDVDTVITQHPEFDKSQREWVTYIRISAALRAKNGG